MRRSMSKKGSQSAPHSGTQILVKSGGCPAKECQVESNFVRELYVSYSYRNMVGGNISRNVKSFHIVLDIQGVLYCTVLSLLGLTGPFWALLGALLHLLTN